MLLILRLNSFKANNCVNGEWDPRGFTLLSMANIYLVYQDKSSQDWNAGSLFPPAPGGGERVMLCSRALGSLWVWAPREGRLL